MSFSISYLYEVLDKYTAPLDKITKATDKFSKRADSASKKARRLGDKLTGMAGNISGAAGTISAAVAVMLPTSKAVAFEAQMANVKKVLNDITPKQFKELTKTIQASAEQLGRVPVAVGEIAEQAGKTGVPVEDMQHFIKLVAKTAISFDMLDATAGENLGQLRTRLKLSVGGVEELMDSVNFMADNTSANGERMIRIIGRLSGEFNDVEMPPKLIAGWASFADQVEVTPELAASGLSQLMRKIKTMPHLGELIYKDPTKAISQYLKKFEKVPKAVRALALKKELGEEAGKFATKAINQLDLLDKSLRFAASEDAIGSMTRELVTKTDTAAFKLAQIKAAIDNLFIDLGGPTLDIIKEMKGPIIKLANAVRDFVQHNPQLTRFATIMMGIVAVVAPTVLIVGMLATAVGALLSPVGIAIGAVALLVGGMAALAVKNNNVRDGLVRIWEAISPVAEAFGGLFSSLGKGLDWAGGIAMALQVVAEAIEFIVAPLKILQILMNGLITGDFVGALKAAGQATVGALAVDLDRVQGKDLATVGALAGQGKGLAAQAAQATAATLNGQIGVKLDKGLTTSSATMETSMPGNLGFNMARSH